MKLPKSGLGEAMDPYWLASHCSLVAILVVVQTFDCPRILFDAKDVGIMKVNFRRKSLSQIYS